MNQRLKIYLDTSVPNFLFADDSPEKTEVTLDLFSNFIKTSIYRSCISQVVIAEIDETKDNEKRLKLLNIFKEYPIEVLDYSETEE
jgi:hypothetical protein